MSTCEYPEHGWGVGPCVPCLQAALTAERERAARLDEALAQGVKAFDVVSKRAEKAEAELDALRERVARLVELLSIAAK